jgi:hypothetical protein
MNIEHFTFISASGDAIEMVNLVTETGTSQMLKSTYDQMIAEDTNGNI